MECISICFALNTRHCKFKSLKCLFIGALPESEGKQTKRLSNRKQAGSRMKSTTFLRQINNSINFTAASVSELTIGVTKICLICDWSLKIYKNLNHF